MDDQQQSPPGWYPDPDQPSTKRWWNGHEWTEPPASADPDKGGPPRPAGWLHDPWGESDQRWWTGSEWSHRTRSNDEATKSSKRTNIIVFAVLALLIAPFVLMSVVSSSSDGTSGLTGSAACSRTAVLIRDADLMNDREIREALQVIESHAYGSPVHPEAREALAAATSGDTARFSAAIRDLNRACSTQR